MSGGCTAAPSADRSSRGNYRVVALIVASTMIMEQIDATVLTTALPTIARDFREPVNALGLVLTAYLLAVAAFIPLSGRLADRFGARSVLRAAILVFMAGSLLCAFSTSAAQMGMARFVQGAGGAMMTPVGRIALLRVTRRQDLVSATAWLVTPALLGPMLGPPIGGLIVTHLDWRWIFYVNLPVGLAGIAAISLHIDNGRADAPGRADIPGFLICAAGLGTLLLGCESASQPGRLGQALLLLAVAGVMAGTYVRHAARRPDPLLDLTVLRDRSFRLSLIGGSLTRITQGAQPFLLPLMFQVGFGFSAAVSGAIMLATAVGSLVSKAIVSPVLRRLGFRRSLIVNGLLSSLCYGLAAAFRADWPVPLTMAVLTLAGFFMSFQFSVYNTVAYEGVEAARISRASSLYSTFQQLLLSLGICTASVAIQASMAVRGSATPHREDFAAALVAVALISLSAFFVNRRFAPDAGSAMSGHVPRAEQDRPK
ncbi:MULTISPECIES: MFS transporter [Sphingobium]|uniref:MFS transporter n=1 Tax=Sphingobium fuliginis (strain ATCC 27551) TaxID=336203 RepID=A0ABQ1EZ70_SPHSA|nr:MULTISPECIES: MFS transporter [Sphingobium]RYL98025.1 MFS transporter [Sphingobium fuliginis]WDA34734.1 MFS transporter [Sphingobium sp. YC-XJ3]GFZ92554.1 MFS transporter [Sphingobium fuliginis]